VPVSVTARGAGVEAEAARVGQAAADAAQADGVAGEGSSGRGTMQGYGHLQKPPGSVWLPAPYKGLMGAGPDGSMMVMGRRRRCASR